MINMNLSQKHCIPYLSINAITAGVVGDQDALCDSPRVLRVLGTVARDQYVVSFLARTGVLGRR